MNHPALAMIAIPEAQTSYWVACSACRTAFDALDAEWCACLVTERTLVCPRCGACFCKAPASYKSRFWSGAPQSLWEAKYHEHRSEDDAFEALEGVAHRPLVLVVDDEAVIRRVALRALRAMGYGVALARNGVGGLEAARVLQPDLILTDALMPKLDGRDLCRLVKDDPELARIPVVVMTALYTSIKHRLDGHKRYGADDYLVKPVATAALQAVVDRFLRPRAQEAAPSPQQRPSRHSGPKGGTSC